MSKLSWTQLLFTLLTISASTTYGRSHPSGHSYPEKYTKTDAHGTVHGYGDHHTDVHAKNENGIKSATVDSSTHSSKGHGYGGGYAKVKDGYNTHYGKAGSYGTHGGRGHGKAQSGGTDSTDYGKSSSTSNSYKYGGKGSGHAHTYSKNKDRETYTHGSSYSRGKDVSGGGYGGSGSSDIGLKASAAYSLTYHDSDDKHGYSSNRGGGHVRSKDKGQVHSSSYGRGYGKGYGVSGGIGAATDKGSIAIHATGGRTEDHGYSHHQGHTVAKSKEGDTSYAYGSTKTRHDASGGTLHGGISSQRFGIDGAGGAVYAKGEGGHAEVKGGSGVSSKRGGSHNAQRASVSGHGEVTAYGGGNHEKSSSGVHVESHGGHAEGHAEGHSYKNKEKPY